MTLREAAGAMLDHAERMSAGFPPPAEEWFAVRDALRAALAAPAPEPVAWGVVNASGRFRKARGTKAAAERSLAQWLEDQSKKGYSNWRGHVVPLYAAPPDTAALRDMIKRLAHAGQEIRIGNASNFPVSLIAEAREMLK